MTPVPVMTFDTEAQAEECIADLLRLRAEEYPQRLYVGLSRAIAPSAYYVYRGREEHGTNLFLVKERRGAQKCHLHTVRPPYFPASWRTKHDGAGWEEVK